MRISVSYVSKKFYTPETINQWRWYYKPYTFINGFIMRIFGVYINVRENNSTEKLIKISRERKKP